MPVSPDTKWIRPKPIAEPWPRILRNTSRIGTIIGLEGGHTPNPPKRTNKLTAPKEPTPRVSTRKTKVNSLTDRLSRTLNVRDTGWLDAPVSPIRR